MTSEPATWWQRAVFYQIYVRSFQDSDGDGVGDLAGVTRRIDYLRWLGVDAIWLTPFYPSPLEDLGYDVADYVDVDSRYGSLDDFDVLVRSAHEADIRVVVDFVANHTSVQHPWFQESRASRDNPKRDWYIWRSGAGTQQPPNNWRGQGPRDRPGGGWTYDEPTGQWYLSNFSPAQPELNWHNPDVQSAMADVARFWLDRGVDGFRIDMADFLGKDPQFREEAADIGDGRDYIAGARFQVNRPETLDYLGLLRDVLRQYDDRVLIGEVAYYLPLERFAEYSGPDLLDMPTNFRLTFLPMEAAGLKSFIDSFEAATDADRGWPNYCLGNHDSPRYTRHGRAARLALMLLLTLRGTPFIYYGDEIGMTDAVVPEELRVDLLSATGGSRDGARSPMQWSAEPVAGFCPPDVTPWLPLASDWEARNVAAERLDPGSFLTLTQQLLDLRHRELALSAGSYEPVPSSAAGCLQYGRACGSERFRIMLNFSAEPVSVALPHPGMAVISTDGAVGTDTESSRFGLAPYQGLVVRMAAPPSGTTAAS